VTLSAKRSKKPSRKSRVHPLTRKNPNNGFVGLQEAEKGGRDGRLFRFVPAVEAK